MGLFDGALGNVVGNVLNEALGTGQAQGGGQMMRMAMALLQQHGGLAGIVDLLDKNGLGQQVASWVGTGENQPVNSEDLGQALGGQILGSLASKLGISSQDVSQGLAQHLPQLINHLTPDGQVPDQELVEQGLAALGGKLFG